MCGGYINVSNIENYYSLQYANATDCKIVLFCSTIDHTNKMELAFEDINVYAGQKHILNNVFGLSKSGQLLVIMGPSGKCGVIAVSVV